MKETRLMYFMLLFKYFVVADVFVTMRSWCEDGEMVTGVNNVIKIDWCCDSDNTESENAKQNIHH